jgi:hypothetical protein
MVTLTPKMIETIHGINESLNRVAEIFKDKPCNTIALGTMAETTVSISWKGNLTGSILVSRKAGSEEIEVDVDLHGMRFARFKVPKHGLPEIQNWIEHHIY